MTDFPSHARQIPVAITSLHLPDHSAVLSGAASSQFAWPVANLAVLFPFTINKTCNAKRIGVANGNTASGNIDVGIYRDDLSKLVSSGSTAHAGVAVTQFPTISAVQLAPGRYYLAIAVDNATAAFFRFTPPTTLMRVAGCLQMATAFPLPTTVTPDAGGVANAYLPVMGIETLRMV